MITGIWGRKIGMTQVFHGDKVVPVTAVDLSCWVVIGMKTTEQDGYNALQVGCIRARYKRQTFSLSWLKNQKRYFCFVREVKVNAFNDQLQLGSLLFSKDVFVDVKFVHVTGKTRGRGFAGVVKRHGFTGAPASHGAKMGKAPGAASHLRACGKVIKGKRYPGHLGMVRKTIQNLEMVQVRYDDNVVLLKGAIPGKTGSLLYIQKSVR